MVEVLKQAGMLDVSSEVLNIVSEHRRQLVSTVLQDRRRDRVWPGCFVGVLPLEQSDDIPLQGGESHLVVREEGVSVVGRGLAIVLW